MLTSAVKGKRVYCETGFNNGHSALSVMQAELNLVVHSFDIGKNWSHASFRLLSEEYPQVSLIFAASRTL